MTHYDISLMLFNFFPYPFSFNGWRGAKKWKNV